MIPKVSLRNTTPMPNIMSELMKGPKPVGKSLKIGLIGSRGQLGSELLRRFSAPDFARSIALCSLDRPGFDITSEASLGSLIGAGFDTIINASAYNAVDKAETEIEACFRLNAFAPHALAKACRDSGTALLHVSTDYVMSGGINEEEQIPYSEDSPVRPLSVYGISKAAGERLAASAWERTWIVRTCGLYGAGGSGQKGGNFVTTMLRLAREGRPIRVVSDQRVGPTSARDLAHGIATLVTAAHPFGIWHLTNDGNVSWFEFAREIFALSGQSPDLTPMPLSEYRPAAPRSPFSVLSNGRAHRAGIVLPGWNEALESYLGTLGVIRS